jgi:hypothetical protein
MSHFCRRLAAQVVILCASSTTITISKQMLLLTGNRLL